MKNKIKGDLTTKSDWRVKAYDTATMDKFIDIMFKDDLQLWQRLYLKNAYKKRKTDEVNK